MSVKVSDLIRENTITAQKHHSVAYVKELMSKNKVNSIPIVGSDNEVMGIISSADLLEDTSDNTPISSIMTEKVYTIPMYSDVQLAARIMRNHKIHHLLVTHEKKLVGIISSFDLLKLIESNRFSMKNPPTPKKHRGKRSRAEA